MASLVISFEPDPLDEVGKLFFKLDCGQFAGSGCFWSNLGELPELLTRLECYPLSRPVDKNWGFEDGLGRNRVLSLSIEQIEARGTLLVQVEIANQYSLDQRLKTSFHTDYASLDSFRRALGELGKQRSGEALLAGE